MPNLILVVDDDPITRLQMRQLLMQVGYRVAEAANGKEALAVYQQEQPDMILLDAMMPIMDGFTCCTQLQLLPGGSAIPVLMITGLYDQESVDKAFAAGATDYITKPIQWQVLRQRVRRMLEARRAMQELEIHAKRQALVAELSQIALAGLDLTTLMQETVALVSHSLEVEYCDILELLPDENTLRLVAGVGWHSGLVGQATISASSDSQAWYTLRSQETAIVTDFSTETRFGKPQLPHNNPIVSGTSLLIHGKEHPFGVLEVYTTKTRTFSKEDVYFLLAVTNMLATAIERQKFEDVLRGNEQRSQLFADVTLKIRQSLQIDEILQTSVTEVQKLLQADRVLIFRLLSDGTGKIVQEEVVPGFLSILGHNIEEPCFNEDYVQLYRQGRISSVSDIQQAHLAPCYLEFLKKLGVTANLVVPILLKNKLWGLLIAHQCDRPREWTSWEIELLQQLADQIGIALAQAQLLEQETRQRQELARSNEELQQFAFIASHDLQEPLRKIKTFGERLKATCGDALTEQGQDYLERMQNATRRMQALIEDLLTLSRVTTRAKPFERVDLNQVTREVLSDLEISILQTEARIEVEDLPTVHADPLQMRQLLQNLIGNALKFHRQGISPIIKIYARQDASQQGQLIIEDNGIGFDEKYLARIFNVFQRLHGRNEYEGTGMGLAIARKIVERHSWSITADSQLGQGAKFIVSLAFL
jgi:GAF domain-containing protein/CheY-like chemotaxis protein